ncbi:MAG: TolC family protein [Odoribacter sp.]|nr:TolC family protein [Odoribacter sp.]
MGHILLKGKIRNLAVRILYIGFLCTFFPLHGNSQEIKTLEECIESALDANYSIKIVRNEEEIAENNVSLAPFLPTVDINAQQNQQINNSKTTNNGTDRTLNGATSNSLSTGAGLRWTLFDGMAMFTTYDRYKELLTIGELNTRLTLENLIVEVSTAYYDIIMKQSQSDAARHSLELSSERFNEARDKYNLGMLSGLELQQAKIDLNADSSTFMKQKEYLMSSYITLNALMNEDLQHSSYVKDTIILMSPLRFADLKENALMWNTVLEMARTQQKISALDVKLARSELYPTLDFSSGYNYSRTKNPSSVTTFNRSNGFYWGFSVNLTVFDRLENKRKIKNARIQQDNSEWTYKEVELQILVDLAQLYDTYQNNLQIVNFEIESADVAFENLDAALEKYKLGSLSGIEFREFQRSYIDAVDRKLSAIYQAKISEIELLLLSGDIKI